MTKMAVTFIIKLQEYKNVHYKTTHYQISCKQNVYSLHVVIYVSDQSP